MTSNTYINTSETSRVTKLHPFFDEKHGYFDTNYQPSFINPLLTDEQLESLMYTDNSQEILANPGTQVEELGGNDGKNKMKATEFLLMGSVNAQGWDAFSIENSIDRSLIDDEYNRLLFFGIIDDYILAEILANPGTQVEHTGSWALKKLSGYDRKNQKKALEIIIMSAVEHFLSDEKYNGLLCMFSKANFPSSGVTLTHDSILLGTRSKRELSDTGHRIPLEIGNPADINQARGVTDNVADNVEAQATNNGENEDANDDIAGDGDGGGGGANNDQNEALFIYRYVFTGQGLHINLVEQIQTNVIANEWRSWDELVWIILSVYRQRHPDYNQPEDHFFNASDCWPGHYTIFGRRSNGRFQSITRRAVDRFEDHERDINCLLVIEDVNVDINLILEDDRMYAFLYDFSHDDMQINFVDQFSEVSRNNLQSWADFSREIYRIYRERTQGEVVQVREPNPSNCWPEADTIFGLCMVQMFQILNWPKCSWDDTANMINCAILIRY